MFGGMDTLIAPSEATTAPVRRRSRLGALRRLTRTDIVIATSALGAAATTAFDGPQPWPLVRGLVVALTAVALIRTRATFSGRWAGLAVAAYGLAAAIVGVGVGGSRLLEVGPADVSGVGVILAVPAGVVLLVLGARSMLAGTRWWHKLLAIPPGIVVTGMLGVSLSVGLMMTNAAPMPLGDTTPADVGLEYEDVELRTSDGVRLEAWYVPSQNGAAVVLLAGAGSTRDGEVERAAALAGEGFGVLLLDVRGHGGSGGEANLMGWYGELDVEPGIDYLLARPDVRDGRVGVVGMSMGGQQAVAAAGADTRIRAVVADGVVGRHSGENDAPNVFDGALGWMMIKTTELTTGAPHPTPLVDAVRTAAPNPVLVIAAGQGAMGMEADFAEKLLDASPETVEVWNVDDVSHTQAFSKHRGEWTARVTDFLEAAMA
jgi:pimeloyl-ACP methyl ester carboxylesterase